MQIVLNDGTSFDIVRMKKDGRNEEKLRIEIPDTDLIEVLQAFDKDNNTSIMKMQDIGGSIAGEFIGYTIRESIYQDNFKDLNEKSHTRVTLVYQLENTDVTLNRLLKSNRDLQNEIKSLNQQLNPTVDYDAMSLEECRECKQQENNIALKAFLEEQTVIFNGKEYGVSYDDQSEMMANLTQYRLSEEIKKGSGVLEWHAKKEKCQPFSLEDFMELSMLIKLFVYPYVSKCQDIKQQIFNCETKSELKKIKFEYEVIIDD